MLAELASNSSDVGGSLGFPVESESPLECLDSSGPGTALHPQRAEILEHGRESEWPGTTFEQLRRESEILLVSADQTAHVRRVGRDRTDSGVQGRAALGSVGCARCQLVIGGGERNADKLGLVGNVGGNNGRIDVRSFSPNAQSQARAALASPVAML